jgi:NAD-dependent SIR2 family protein deacetylase
MGEAVRAVVSRPSFLRDLGSREVAEAGDVDTLAALVGDGGVVVLSGAGMSTESGIPDYRGPQGALRRHTPMTYQEFTASADGARRYWARSFVGWRHVARARPNTGHRAVAALEHAGYLDGLVTQNVDGLHHAAGSRTVIDLHGSLDRVVCLACGDLSDRADLDDRMRTANPGFEQAAARALAAPGVDGRVNPDGDVALPEDAVAGFVVPECPACGSSTLKPDVVFFGEKVPPHRVQHSSRLVDAARALLVLGTSLTVMSGYRFCLQAHERGIPVAIVNQGPTRGDERATIRLNAALGEVLQALEALLAPALRSQ